MQLGVSWRRFVLETFGVDIAVHVARAKVSGIREGDRFDVQVTVHRDKLFDVQVTVHRDKLCDVQVTVHRAKMFDFR